MVDRDLVRRKLAALDEYVAQLGEYRTLTADGYRRDWRTQRIVDRTLQIAIEACIDVAEHVIADRRLPVPQTAGEVFQVLADAGLLPGDLRDTMSRMAGFRNVVVHEYAGINPATVVDILCNRLGDFTRFREVARTWLED